MDETINWEKVTSVTFNEIKDYAVKHSVRSQNFFDQELVEEPPVYKNNVIYFSEYKNRMPRTK